VTMQQRDQNRCSQHIIARWISLRLSEEAQESML
jgi:hypothetical protein